MVDSTQNSELRLFLSVDIVGSTQLKDRQNYQIFNNLYKNKQKILANFTEQILNDDELLLNKTGKEREILGKISGQINYFIEQELFEDWAKTLEETFKDFHAYFRGDRTDCQPWKALGDELIYSFKINDRSNLHDLIIRFLETINYINDTFISKNLNYIRLKGSAWTAGFPIRNRKISLPDPLPEDYLGPDMDIGFRLGKCTWPGFLTISMDLAELLGECNITQQIRLKLVKWEKLRGVWKEKPYPIFWAVLPEKTKVKDGKILNEEYYKDYYNGGDEVESSYLYGWIHNEKVKPEEAKQFISIIEQIRKAIPKEIGVVDPYIIGDAIDGRPDKMPLEHEEILKLIRNFNPDKQEDQEQQGTLPLNDKEDVKSLMEDMKKLVEEIKEQN